MDAFGGFVLLLFCIKWFLIMYEMDLHILNFPDISLAVHNWSTQKALTLSEKK